jgi:transient receptor potential cation channel subfamily A protein 1
MTTSLADVLSSIVPHSSPLHPERLVRASNLKELQACIHYGKVDPKTWRHSDSGRSLLHYAATANQVEAILFLISECRVSINVQDRDGNTPLHEAVMTGHLEAADVLLAHNADDTIRNAKQDPPLHTAIKLKSEHGNKLVSGFVKHPHVNLFTKGYHGYSSLHITASHNNLEALELLYGAAATLEASVIRSHLLAKDNNGLTAYHVAARVNSPDVLEFFLSKSSLCGISAAELQGNLSNDSRSPFHYAIERDNLECTEVFLKYGADPTSTSSFQPPPLHVACSHGKLSILRAMVDTCGDKILQVRDQEGGTALHSSTSSIFSQDLISYLVVEKVVGIDEVDSNGFSPLSNAIQLGNLTAVDVLLKLGADPLLEDKWGCNCLHRAVLGKRMEVFKKLIGCDSARVMATSPNNQGHYPIHDALKLGMSEVVATLLEVTTEEFKDPDGNNYMHLAASSGDEKTLTHLLNIPQVHHMINEANSSGCTPLHFAAARSSIIGLRKLMDYGAVIHKNNDGHTPFMQACCAGNLEAVELLYYANKFQRDWVDLCGCSSLHLAVDGGNPEVITFCLDIGTAIVFNEHQCTFFDKILDLSDVKLATAALNHRRWDECINVFSPDKPHPILRILDEIPEAYGIILDHCYTHSSLDHAHSDYWEEFDFKCLIVQSKPSSHQEVGVSDVNGDIEMTDFHTLHTQLHTENDVAVESLTPQVQQSRPAGRMRRLFGGNVKKDSLAVVRKLLKIKQEDYLLHPVVRAFISIKWFGFGVFFQAAIMVIHFLLALFFSIFIVAVGPPPQVFNASTPDSLSVESDYDSISVGSEVLLFITLLISIFNLLVFFLQAYIHGIDLISNFLSSIQTWLNLLASFCTFLFLLSVLVKGLKGALWNSAAIGIFFAWFSFGATLQLLNLFRIGVYITMMLSIAKLIVKVLTILASFLFAFSFSFYILVGSVLELQYSTIGLSTYSVFHSLIAVTDYLGFARIEQEGGFRFEVLTFIMVVTLVVFVPIVFINLLIGLAVGDIAAMQRVATISHIAVEVRALASLDKRILPHRFTKHVSKSVHRLYPNKIGRLRWLHKIFHSESSDAHSDPVREKVRQYVQVELEAERKRHGNQLHNLNKELEQLVVEAQGIKRLELMVAKLMDLQTKNSSVTT